MWDQIAAIFRGPWRLELNGDQLGLVGVIKLQAAWAALTKHGQRALVDLAEVPGSKDWHHPLTVKALVRHGLVDESGAVTPAGRAVLAHRPVKHPLPDVEIQSLRGRSVVDVPLPEET